MKCPACQAEVGQATRCPRCHTVIDATEDPTGPRGRFRGRMSGPGARKGAQRVSLIGAMGRMLMDPAAPFRSKFILVAAILYVLLPLDLLPGGLIPVIGWLDDIIVSLLAWSFIGPDVRRYKSP